MRDPLQEVTRTPPRARSSGRSRHPLELNQPADVVAEVHHPDLEPRPRDADGAHDLAAHRALLVAEYMLDTGAHPRASALARGHDAWVNAVSTDQSHRRVTRRVCGYVAGAT